MITIVSDDTDDENHLGLVLPPDDEHGREVEELQRSSCMVAIIIVVNIIVAINTNVKNMIESLTN